MRLLFLSENPYTAIRDTLLRLQAANQRPAMLRRGGTRCRSHTNKSPISRALFQAIDLNMA
jgi:hypothetical protein